MKRLFFLITSLSPLIGFTQIEGTIISGKKTVQDNVNISLLRSADSVLVKATTSNTSGRFRFSEIPYSSYMLRVSAIGYQTLYSSIIKIDSVNQMIDVGNLDLTEVSENLDQVIVRAKKPLFEQQVSGTTINVSNSILSKGYSALEVLERAPGVAIDRRSSSISLNGKSGVLVMLNGKLIRMPAEQLINFLNSASANEIEKIELMNTPPSKFDAEGNAGIINIVLKRKKNQASVSLTAGYGWGEKAGANLNFSRSNNKANYYGSYSFAHDRSYANWFSTASDLGSMIGGPNQSTFLSVIKPVSSSHNSEIGFDTKLNSLTTAGANLMFNASAIKDHTTNHARYDLLSGREYIFDTDIISRNKWKNVLASGFLERKIGTNNLLSLNIDYLAYLNQHPGNAVSSFADLNGNLPSDNDTAFAENQRSFSNSRIRVGVMKLDYQATPTGKIRFEAGLKATYTNNQSDSRIESFVNNSWINWPSTKNDIVMKEGIAAAYASFSMQASKAVEWNAGLRYEYAQTEISENNLLKTNSKRHLGNFFPVISLTFKSEKNSKLYLSYSKRISRPSYTDLASFVAYTGPISIETGNSLLKPTITNNLKLGYNFRNYNFSVLLSRDDHPIARYQAISSANGDLLVIAPQNVNYQNNLLLQSTLPVRIFSWWNINSAVNFGLHRFSISYTAVPVIHSYFSYNANLSQTFSFSKNYSIELSTWYNSKAYNGSKRQDGFGAVNAGVRKELKKNAGIIQISVTDLFRTGVVTSYFGTLTQEAFNLRSKVPYTPESSKVPIFKITYTKSFGLKENSRLRHSSKASQEERERIRN